MTIVSTPFSREDETATQSLFCRHCNDLYNNRTDFYVHLLKCCDAGSKDAKKFNFRQNFDDVHQARERLLNFEPPEDSRARRVMAFLDESVTHKIAEKACVLVANFSDMYEYVTATTGEKRDSWNLEALAGSLKVPVSGLVAALLDNPVILIPLLSGPYPARNYHVTILVVTNEGIGQARKTELFEFCSNGSEVNAVLAASLRKALELEISVQNSTELKSRLQKQWPDTITVTRLNEENLQDKAFSIFSFWHTKSIFSNACTYFTRWYIHVVLFEIWCNRTSPKIAVKKKAPQYMQLRMNMYYSWTKKSADFTNTPEKIENEVLCYNGAEYLLGPVGEMPATSPLSAFKQLYNCRG